MVGTGGGWMMSQGMPLCTRTLSRVFALIRALIRVILLDTIA